MLVPLRKLNPSPNNPRVRIDKSALKVLAASIREHGLLQAITVREAGPETYEVVYGNRRLEACRMIEAEDLDGGIDAPRGLQWIDADLCVPVEVRAATDVQAVELALAENVIREDMDALDRCETYARLVRDGRSVKEIARAFTMPKRLVEQTLALAQLVPGLKKKMRDGKMDWEVAQLATVLPPAQQEKLAKEPGSLYRYDVEQWRRDTLIAVDRALPGVLEAYAADGHPISEDLFGKERYFADRDAFLKLQRVGFEAARQAAVDAGYAHVEVMASQGYFDRGYPASAQMGLKRLSWFGRYDSATGRADIYERCYVERYDPKAKKPPSRDEAGAAADAAADAAAGAAEEKPGVKAQQDAGKQALTGPMLAEMAWHHSLALAHGVGRMSLADLARMAIVALGGAEGLVRIHGSKAEWIRGLRIARKQAVADGLRYEGAQADRWAWYEAQLDYVAKLMPADWEGEMTVPSPPELWAWLKSLKDGDVEIILGLLLAESTDVAAIRPKDFAATIAQATGLEFHYRIDGPFLKRKSVAWLNALVRTWGGTVRLLPDGMALPNDSLGGERKTALMQRILDTVQWAEKVRTGRCGDVSAEAVLAWQPEEARIPAPAPIEPAEAGAMAAVAADPVSGEREDDEEYEAEGDELEREFDEADMADAGE